VLHSPLMEPAAVLTVRPWPDTVVDRVGHDPRSRYVEQFWLGVLGPSTTWFLRLVANRLDAEPQGFDLDLRCTARTLGLGPPEGRHSPLHRSVERTVRFGLARTTGPAGLDVRRRLPPLNRGQVARLPEPVRRAHADWQAQELVHDRFEEAQRRARRLALSLFEAGEDPDTVERELHRWHHHPALASAATAWALDRHRQAQATAADAGAV
jgi:hypothetical protein